MNHKKGGVEKMKATTKKTIITIINIIIFIGNAILTQLGNNVDGSMVASVSSAVFTCIACA